MKDWLKNLDRETMIRALIQGDIETNGGDGDWFVAGLLRHGCKGYNDLTDDQLREAIEAAYEAFDDDELDEAHIRELAERRGED